MADATVERKGNKVIITLEFSKEGTQSKSGKSAVHATTHGNMPCVIDGRQMYVGVNLYSR